MHTPRPVMTTIIPRAPRRSVRVGGEDVMAWTGLPAGPRVGELLAGLALEAAAGRVRGRRDAQAWLRTATGDTGRAHGKRRDTG